MLVMKFGGTSVQDAAALQRVRGIVTQAASPVVVVLSATSGTTDMLLQLGHAAGMSDVHTVDELLAAIAGRHGTIAADLGIPNNAAVAAMLDAMTEYTQALLYLGECTPQSLDEIVSFGERLSTTLFAEFLRAEHVSAAWFDVRSVMRTDDTFQNATVQRDVLDALCQQHLAPLLDTHHAVVTQGFVGRTNDGRTTTLGRGGSDYTGALLGAALRATEIQIWTDVSGIYSADPRIVPQARPIGEMSFQEVRELALYGAKVLHPDTIAPAIERTIPVRVANTFQPTHPGTLIAAEEASDADLHAVTLLRSCQLVRTRTPLQHAPATTVLTYHSLEHASTIVHCRTEADTLELNVNLSGIEHQREPVATIAVCGPRASAPASVARIAKALDGFRTHGIVAGTSDVSIYVIVPEAEAIAVLVKLHEVVIG